MSAKGLTAMPLWCQGPAKRKRVCIDQRLKAGRVLLIWVNEQITCSQRMGGSRRYTKMF